MSVSYRRESAWSQFPLPFGDWLTDAVSFVANLPLWATLLALLGLMVLAGVIVAGVFLFVMLGPVPIPRELASAKAASSMVYAPDGSLLATWHGPINRQPVPLNRISPNLPKAVVAEEDARFYSEPGIDLRSIARAAIADLLAGRIVEGGSTLTQQYVKDAYVGNKPTFTRKILEARVALTLTHRLTRNQIMDRYLNTVYFGDGAYGAQAAAQTYFGENASQLTVSQAALLAGIIHAPDVDAPTRNPAGAKADRLRVIGRMEALKYITPAQADQARAARTVLATPVAANPNFAWYMDALHTSMVSQYGSAMVDSGGLQIHATLDPAMQASAEASTQAALPNPADPSAALVAIDPSTGYVRAIVGGRNYAVSQFNIATMGRRQPGSAFKPFVLAAALEQGISPQAAYRGPSLLCLKNWYPGCVTNFDHESFGSISLLNATVNSVNTVYAQLILQVGVRNVVKVAEKMGIPAPPSVVPPQVGCRPLNSPVCQTYLPAVPSLALGSASVTPLEMASGYATLAAGGVYRAPKLVSEVTTDSGRVLQSGPSPGVQAIPANIAQEETQILQQVVLRGTGTAASIGQPAAGKTGTAQHYDNAWFVGYTPALATSVWVGYPNSNRPLLNVEGVAQVVGGTIPAKIWSRYMQGALDTSPPTLTLGAGLPDAAVTNQTVPSFSGTAADTTGKVMSLQASLDGAPYSTAGVACSACPAPRVTWTYKPPAALGDGSHTLKIRSVNMSGRTSPVIVRRFTVDTVPPTAVSLQAHGGVDALTAVFSKPMLCSSLDPRQFQALVGGRYSRVTSVQCNGTTNSSVGLMLALPPRGGDKVAVTMGAASSGGPTDQAGNFLAGSRTVDATASNVGPSLAVTGGLPAKALTNDAQPTYRGTAVDPDGNVTAILTSVDGAPFDASGISCSGCYPGAPVAMPVSWVWLSPLRLPDGQHSVAVESVDNAGAHSSVVTQTVTIDTVPPRADRLSATGGVAGVTAGFSKPMLCSSLAPPYFTGSLQGQNDAVTGVSCAGTTNTTVGLTLASPPRGGDRVVIAIATPFTGGPTDQAGNHVASPAMLQATATNVAPNLTVSGGTAPGALTSDAQPSYQGQAVDPDGNVTGIQASIDGGPFTGMGGSCPACVANAPLGAPVAWTWRPASRLADGAHSIALRSIDNAGAGSAAVTETVTVDTVPPRPTGLHASGGAAALTATFSKALACSSLNATDFSATTGGQPDTVIDATCRGAASGTIGLQLATPVRGGDTVVVTISAAVTDQAGNQVSGPRMTGVATNAAPSLHVTHSSGAPVFTSNPRPSFAGDASDPDGSVVAVQASVDGGRFSSAGVACTGCVTAGSPGPINSPVTWVWTSPYRLGNGPHTIALRSVDNGGTTSAAVTQTVALDSAAPALQAVMASPGADVISLIFTKPVLCSSVDLSEFTVTVAGAGAPVTVVSCAGTSDAVVDLGLTQDPGMGAPVQVTLSRGITDDAGTALSVPPAAGTIANLDPSELP